MILRTFQTRVLLFLILAPLSSALASDKCVLDEISRLEIFLDSGHNLRQLGQRVAPEVLKTNLQKLTGELPLDHQGSIENRYSEDNKKRVADFLLQTLNSYGLETYFEEVTYERSRGGFFSEREEGVVRNIVGELAGNDSSGEIFEIVAHYDSENERAPGADDNGTGVVTSLEIARILAQFGTKKTLRVVFTDLEEKHSEGADLHLESVKENNEEILGALVLDQFGFAPLGPHRPTTIIEVGEQKESSSKRWVQGHPTEENYEKTETLAKAVLYQFRKYSDRFSTLEPLTRSAEPDVGDHGSYWINEVPALFFSTPQKDSNPHTHRSTDQISHMNWMFFLDNARFALEATALFVGPDLEKLELEPIDSDYWDKTANLSLDMDTISVEQPTTPRKTERPSTGKSSTKKSKKTDSTKTSAPTEPSPPAIKSPTKPAPKAAPQPQAEISLEQDPLDQVIERELERLREEVKAEEAQKERLLKSWSDQKSSQPVNTEASGAEKDEPGVSTSEPADQSSRNEEKKEKSWSLRGALKKVLSSSDENEK